VIVLFVGPGGDPAADVLRNVGKQVRLVITGSVPGLQIVELWDAAADRPGVDVELVNSPNVLYFGHGFEDALSDPALVDVGNVANAAGRIVLAMCCSSADLLGRDAVNQEGVAAYLGFTRPIFVPLSNTWSLTPWYVAGTQLVTGAAAGAVEDDTRRAFMNEGDRIYNSQLPDFLSAVNDMLLHYGMAQAFVCLGDRTATL
jgi:hypothetical protein